jgi:hypothetical protein
MLIKLGQNHYRHGISRQEFYVSSYWNFWGSTRNYHVTGLLHK